MLLTALVIGAVNLATRFLGDRMELLRLRFEQSKEERGLQRAWLREHNKERYDKVKNWVIEVMKVVDPSPIAWEIGESAQSVEGTPSSRPEALEKLNAQAAEVKVFASSDRQLAQELETFIEIVQRLAESPAPEQIREAHSAAAAVVNTVYELMIQVPTRGRPGEAWWRRMRRR